MRNRKKLEVTRRNKKKQRKKQKTRNKIKQKKNKNVQVPKMQHNTTKIFLFDIYNLFILYYLL